jgi:hypothetical protein
MVLSEVKLKGNKGYSCFRLLWIRITQTTVCLYFLVGFISYLLDLYLPWRRRSIALFILSLDSKCRWLHTLAILFLEKEEAGWIPALVCIVWRRAKPPVPPLAIALSPEPSQYTDESKKKTNFTCVLFLGEARLRIGGRPPSEVLTKTLTCLDFLHK